MILLGERGRDACYVRRLAGHTQLHEKVSASRRNRHASRVCCPHEDEVVEDPFGRELEVHDLRKVHLEDGQEELQGGAADVEVFHRRDADDGGGIDGVFAVRDGGNVEDGIRLGQGVLTGVVAERAFFAQRLARVNVAFDDDVGVEQNRFQVREEFLSSLGQLCPKRTQAKLRTSPNSIPSRRRASSAASR